MLTVTVAVTVCMRLEAFPLGLGWVLGMQQERSWHWTLLPYCCTVLLLYAAPHACSPSLYCLAQPFDCPAAAVP